MDFIESQTGGQRGFNPSRPHNGLYDSFQTSSEDPSFSERFSRVSECINPQWMIKNGIFAKEIAEILTIEQIKYLGELIDSGIDPHSFFPLLFEF